VAGVVVGLFLFTFRPFDIDRVDVPNVELFIWGFGLVTTSALLLLLFALPVALPMVFIEERWTVGKNILFFMFIVFVIGTANLYYTHVAAGLPLSFGSFITFQLYTAAVSLIVASVATFVRYTISLKRYQLEAIAVNKTMAEHQEEITSHQPVAAPAVETVLLRSENEKETLTLSSQSLLYIESADNYSDVCFLQNGLVEHRLIRSSLKRIEDNLSHAFCFRCHRSFIVNLNNVSRVTGNSQGYKLHLHHADKPIPVSRRLNDELVTQLQSFGAAPPTR
jgi:hypothetical protein